MSSLSQNKQAVNSVNKNNLEDLGFSAVKCCECDDLAMFISYTEELHWRFCCQEESHGNGRHFYSIPLDGINTARNVFHWISHLETKDWFRISRESWNQCINELLGRHRCAVSPTYPFEEVFCAYCDSAASSMQYTPDYGNWIFSCRDHLESNWPNEFGYCVRIDDLKNSRKLLDLSRYLESSKDWFSGSRASWNDCISHLLGEPAANFGVYRFHTDEEILKRWSLSQQKSLRTIERRLTAKRATLPPGAEN